MPCAIITLQCIYFMNTHCNISVADYIGQQQIFIYNT